MMAGWIKMSLDMEVGLGRGDFVLDGDPAPPPPKGEQPPHFSAHICCGQMAAWIKMSLDMEVGLDLGHFVLDGDPARPSPKGEQSPQIFGPCLLRPNGWMDEGGIWHGGRPQPRRLCVRWGPSFPSPKGAQSPNFLANVHCGQTTAWTKVALAVEEGLGPGDFVFDADLAIPEQRAHPPPPSFWPMLFCGQTAGWI